MNLLYWAAIEAKRIHEKQMRDDGTTPYFTHLLRVVDLVCKYNGSTEMKCAALLHDSIEDQNVSPQWIEEKFGSVIAGYVVALTDLQIVPGESHAEAVERNRLDRARLAVACDEVVLIKLCDIWDNFNDMKGIGEKRRKKWCEKKLVLLKIWAERFIGSSSEYSSTILQVTNQLIRDIEKSI